MHFKPAVCKVGIFILLHFTTHVERKTAVVMRLSLTQNLILHLISRRKPKQGNYIVLTV